jgi:hypothetical protein
MVGACIGRRNPPLAQAREVALEVARFVGLVDQLAMMADALTTASQKGSGTKWPTTTP